ncbi:pantoate--beta-alanine ligase [Benzoatithermus flavus]|uniref:Pantothenate synthetase n=1 Tax=Benzoatithermus flavus TaxID=3108223 RepID=A0ABU8XNL3_9PROT
MSAPIEVVRSIAALRVQTRTWRRQGLTIGLVPTMGALHEGHLSLVRLALDRTDRVVVSIFVNPTQFGPAEDLSRYPRDEAGDLAKLARIGAHLVFMPDVAEMYPAGFSTWVEVQGVSEGLCAVTRPHHFRGVATVVTKLLNQVQADLAVFGEKDYQQLQVIKRLARDLDIPTAIGSGPTVREPDGLAMSSRNLYLGPEERRTAAGLYRVLSDLADALADGSPAGPRLEAARQRLLVEGFTEVDYLELRDAETLAPLDHVADRPARLLAAVFLGKVRLIDNVPVGPAAR